MGWAFSAGRLLCPACASSCRPATAGGTAKDRGGSRRIGISSAAGMPGSLSAGSAAKAARGVATSRAKPVPRRSSGPVSGGVAPPKKTLHSLPRHRRFTQRRSAAADREAGGGAMLRICRKGDVEGGRDSAPRRIVRSVRHSDGLLGPRRDLPAPRSCRTISISVSAIGSTVTAWNPGAIPQPWSLSSNPNIRRHTDLPWPQHADGCDFHRDPAEQRAIMRSYSRPRSGPIGLRIVRSGLPRAEPMTSPGFVSWRSWQ